MTKNKWCVLVVDDEPRSYLKKTEVELSSTQGAAYPGNYQHDIRTERQAA